MRKPPQASSAPRPKSVPAHRATRGGVNRGKDAAKVRFIQKSNAKSRQTAVRGKR